jgi:hypothetical protein
MSRFYKDLAGPHFETLAKAIYRKEVGQITDPDELYLPLLVLPKSLISWCIQNIVPIQIGETKKLNVPGSDGILEVRKIAPDIYSGSILKDAKIINSFEKIPMPALAGTLLNVLELYDEVAGRKVDEMEKQELATKVSNADDRVKDILDKVGKIIDVINYKNTMQPKSVVVNFNMSSDIPESIKKGEMEVLDKAAPSGRERKQKEAAEIEKRIPAKDPSKPLGLDLGKLKQQVEAVRAMKQPDPLDTKDPGNAVLYQRGIGEEPIATMSSDQSPPRQPGGKGISLQGGYVRSGKKEDARGVARAILKRLKQSRQMQKAQEDKLVHPEARKEYRKNRRAEEISPSDPYENQITSELGVSDRGIEARRGSLVEGGIAHGYARTKSKEEHLSDAKKYFKKLYRKIKEQEKPDLTKEELAKQTPKFEAPQKAVRMAPQAPTPPKAPSRAQQPKLNGPVDTVTNNTAKMRAPKVSSTPAQPKMAGAPKAAQPKQPVGMQPIARVSKEEVESAKSDSGSKLFTKEEYDKYKFNPTGLWSVMTDKSLSLQKTENGSFLLYADPKEWDEDNIRLLTTSIKAQQKLKRFGF